MRHSFLLRALACGLTTCLILAGQQLDTASRVYEKASKSVFLIVIRSSTGEPIARGTGFLNADNKIVTNQHVVRDGIPFLDLGAVKLPLKVEKSDSVNDLAILTIDGELSAPALELSTVEPKPGTSIFAIGNPAGLERSISNGVVAGIRQMGGRELVQISAPISPGSSGGPILNSSSEVVAVAVGILEAGQNLNFAVPVKFVQALLKGTVPSVDVPTLLSRVDEISGNRGDYSKDPDSSWMKTERQMEELLRQASTAAGKDVPALKLVADKAMGFIFSTIDPNIAIDAAERMVQVKPNSDSFLMLAKSLQSASSSDNGGKESPNLKRAEKAIRSAFAATKQPTLEMYALMGSILEDRELNTESKAAFLKAYEIAKAQSDAGKEGGALRGLVRVSATFPNGAAETDRWFKVLADAGMAQWYDWDQQARRLYDRNAYQASGDAFAMAATKAPSVWSSFCDAGSAYALAGNTDRELEMARICIAKGINQKDSEKKLSVAHNQIASALNTRGVFEESLGQVREAIAIEPDNAFFQDTLANALIGLRRFQEAITASKASIRLSDGKYSWMHFTLGSAYFQLENWELSRQSFEKAAELDKTDFAAPYNIALCFTNLGYSRDAANWYEEALRRDPNNAKRTDILARIQALRR
jgi:tetratricopeptide (TPR) repeat protein